MIPLDSMILKEHTRSYYQIRMSVCSKLDTYYNAVLSFSEKIESSITKIIVCTWNEQRNDKVFLAPND